MQLSSLKSISLSIIIMVYIKNMNQKKFFFLIKKIVILRYPHLYNNEIKQPLITKIICLLIAKGFLSFAVKEFLSFREHLSLQRRLLN